MAAFRIEALAGIALLALGATASLAQDSSQEGPSGPAVTGPPHALQPGAPDTNAAQESAPNGAAGSTAASPPDSGGPAPAAATSVVPAKPGVLGRRGPAAVEVGALGTLEGAPAGLLDDNNGGLGYDMWANSERGAMDALLQRAPAASASVSVRGLLRRLLLTVAPVPVGPSQTAFNALRIEKLLEGGFIDDASALALGVQAPDNAAIARAQADALLYAGRDADACGGATAYRLQSAEPFWIELRAYCYAVTKDSAALELTRAVMQAQSLDDPAFMTLLNGVLGAKPQPLGDMANATALHIRMMARLKLPMTAVIATEPGVPASLAAMRSVQTPRDLRLAAAEKALHAGALSGAELARVLDLLRFKPHDLVGAAAIAPSESIIPALARLRAALKSVIAPAKRVELIHTAFRLGEQQGLLAQVSALFGDDAAALQPVSDWDNWALLMGRGLILAGQVDAAQRWYNTLSTSAPQAAEPIGELQLALALAVPSDVHAQQSQNALAWFAAQARPGAPSATPGAMANATLAIGLFAALGRPMPPAVAARLKDLMGAALPGRHPAPLLMSRIEGAAVGGRRGEAVLAIIDAMGAEGPVGLAPDITVRLVRALKTLGLDDAAQTLAIEAIVMGEEAGGA